jgi:hypothetical protein
MAAVISPHVSIAWDFSLGVLSHNILLPPATPAPVPTFAVEMIATNMWTLGFLLGQNKFTSSVKHKGSPIVQEAHDDGIMIPDITVPFTNLWYAVMWPFSSRAVKFSASTVKMDGKNVGCADITRGMVMMTCGEPMSAPLGIPAISWLNTVQVGMTGLDLLAGILDIALSMAVSFVLSKIWPSSAASGTAAEQITKAIVGKLVPGFKPKDIAKMIASSLTGLLVSSLRGNPTLKVSVGTVYGGASVTVDGTGVAVEQHNTGVGETVKVDKQGVVYEQQVLGVKANTRGQRSAWGHPL